MKRTHNALLAEIVLMMTLLAGCTLHETQTDIGKTKGMTPMQNTSVGDKTKTVSPFPGEAVETNGASVSSQFPIFILPTPFGPWLIPGDSTVNGLQIDKDGVQVEGLTLNTSPTLAAIALQIDALAKWADVLAEAQAAHDDALAKVASEAIAAGIKALLRSVLGH